MFLGFDETCYHIGKLFDNIKIPPIIKFLLIPYIIIIWMLSVIISISFWILGFWRCSKCRKVFPFWKNKTRKIQVISWEDSNIYCYCNKCIKMKRR